MASETLIANRAMDKLGASRITSLSEDSHEGRACSGVFEILRDAELRSHPWSFATKRAQLAADSVKPSFGKANYFTLPSDFLKLIESDVNLNSEDRIIEGRKIATDESGPLNIRYTARITDVGLMDPLFVEMLACMIALELCETLTQSNSKKESIREDYKNAMIKAKKANAFERPPMQPPEDEWLTIRN